LSNIEVLPLSFKKIDQENPWIDFIGMFEGDDEFAELAAQWQAERDQNADNAA
jgi:hypothetical protein